MKQGIPPCKLEINKMSNQSVIVSKVVHSNNFEIVYKLVSYENEGFSLFNDKWYRSDSGEVMGDRGDKWTCTWYVIGKDVSGENAQKEFDRDCEAFDVDLFVDVNYNGRPLLDEPIIGGDYNWNESASDLLEVLIDYVNIEELVDQAENERLETIKDLQK